MKAIFTILGCLGLLIANSQTVTIDNTGGTSGLIGLGNNLYHASESLYTNDEIGAGNFTSVATAIEKIAFKAVAVGATTTFNNVNIYMKNVPSSTTTLTTGTYSTAGYTLVFSGTVSITATGFTDITLTTPFVRNSGDNLQVLVERSDNTSHAGFNYQTSNGNSVNLTLTTTRRYNGTVALSGSTVLSQSAFRPALRLKHEFVNDIAVQEVYTLGRLPIPNGIPHTVTALIKNFGGTTANNLNVTLNITGANTFTDVQTITTLAPDASQLVTFTSFSPAVLGNNTVTVSIPADDFTDNDSKSSSQIVNENTWSYADETDPFGATGSTTSTVDFAAKFNSNINTSIIQMRLNFSNTGGRTYKVAFWDATGPGGSPGNLIWESPINLTTTVGYNNVVLPAPVAINAGDFYAGVRQVVSASSIFLSYQKESPIRQGAFYYYNVSTSTWVDMNAVTTTPYRLMIEPKHLLAINAAALTINHLSAANCSKNITVTISNAGTNPILPATASVTLKVGGANMYSGTLTNSTTINAGSNEVIAFNGISTPIAGTNYDTAFVTLTGDDDQLNDTIASTFTSGPAATLATVSSNAVDLVKNCEDAGWTFYSDPANLDGYLLAINWDPGNTGANALPKANAIPRIQLDGSFFSATDIPTKKATYTMQRYWNVDLLGNTLTGAVNLRFFYNATEKTAIENAASTFATSNSGTLEPSQWFQLTTSTFAGDVAHVIPDFVLNSYPIYNSNTLNNTINGILYAQFDGLTDLTGGTYATGVGPSTPLPLLLTQFEARQTGRKNVLTWRTANEVNVNKFVIERSNNAVNYTSIGVVNANGAMHYQFIDEAPLKGTNYYRLRIIDQNNSYRISETKVVGFNATGILLYPNPVTQNALLEIDAPFEGSIEINITDVAGKIIQLNTTITGVQQGLNRIPLNMAKLAPGTYFINISTGDLKQSIKFVKL